MSPSTFEVQTTSYPYRDRSIEEHEYRKFDLDPDTHLALRLDLKVAYGPDGKHRNFPKPQGISGAPILELYDENAQGDPSIFPLVGVGIEYRRSNKILVGTDIQIALQMIETLSNNALQASA